MISNLIPVLLLGLLPTQQAPLHFDPADIDPARLADYQAEVARLAARPRLAQPPTPDFDPALVAAQSLGVSELPGGGAVASGPSWHGSWSQGRMRFQELGGDREVEPAAIELELLEIVRESAPNSQLILDRFAQTALERQEMAAAAQVRRELADGISEHWDLTPRGAELYYQLERLPQGEGELIVRLAATTALAAPFGRSAPGKGLSFEGPSGTGIELGAVTGVDAGGATCPGTLDWNGSQLELRLPASFVDSAKLPLRVDPFLSSYTWMYGTSEVDTTPDVAWDEDTQTWGVAFRRVVAHLPGTSGINVRANYLVQRLTWWGGIKGTAVILGTSQQGGTTEFLSQYRMHAPSIVDINGYDEFAVAVVTPSGYVGGLYYPTSIHVMRMKASDGTHYWPVTVVHPTSGNVGSLELATDPLPGYPNFLAVWLANTAYGHQVRSSLVALTGSYTTSFGPEKLLGTPGFARSVHVSPSGGNAGRWLVAWEKLGGTYGPSLGMAARTVRWHGSPESPEVSVGWGQSPRVAGDGVDFMLQYASPIGGKMYAYRAQAWRAGASTLFSGASKTLGYMTADSESAADHHDISMIGERFVSIWRTCDTANKVTINTVLFDLGVSPIFFEANSLVVTASGAQPGFPFVTPYPETAMSFRLSSMGESKPAEASDQALAVCSKSWFQGPINRLRIWD